MSGKIAFAPYHKSLAKVLTTNRQVEAYLGDALMDDDPRLFLVALKHIVDMKGGMTKLSKDTGLNREGLYQTLSVNGNPEYRTLRMVLAWAGVRLALATGLRVKIAGKRKTTVRRKLSQAKTNTRSVR